MTLEEMEKRIIALEAELARVKAQQEPNKADPKWVAAQSGRFANDAGFDEIVRLGREYRKSQKPRAAKKSVRKKSMLQTSAKAVIVLKRPAKRTETRKKA